MATLEQRLTAGFQRVRDQFNGIKPRLVTTGGLSGQVLTKTGSADSAFGWATPAAGGSGLSHFCSAYCEQTPQLGDGDFNRIKINKITSDVESLFDTTNFWYVVPENGVYEITASFRAPDSSGQRDFGFGVHSEQVDGPHFIWVRRPDVQRWTQPYARMARLTAGQKMRMFAYQYPQGTNVDRASFDICLISR